MELHNSNLYVNSTYSKFTINTSIRIRVEVLSAPRDAEGKFFSKDFSNKFSTTIAENISANSGQILVSFSTKLFALAVNQSPSTWLVSLYSLQLRAGAEDSKQSILLLQFGQLKLAYLSEGEIQSKNHIKWTSK